MLPVARRQNDPEIQALLGELVIGVTGHRPQNLGGFSPEAHTRRLRLARQVIGEHMPARVITGMALGWDQAIAQACIDLGIPFTAAVPFEGQERIWPASSQREYRRLLKHAAEVVIVTTKPHMLRDMMMWRNAWIVDNCDLMVALWDGNRMGGTYNCVLDARVKRRPIENAWDRWLATV
jgi:uncharacterized phage-like protein YoqJ